MSLIVLGTYIYINICYILCNYESTISSNIFKWNYIWLSNIIIYIIHIFRNIGMGLAWHIFAMGEAHGQRHEQCQRTSPQMFHGWNVKSMISSGRKCWEKIDVEWIWDHNLFHFLFLNFGMFRGLMQENAFYLYKEDVGVKLQVK